MDSLPLESERKQAKLPHDIFLSNLIANHILLFAALASMGSKYLHLLVIIPVISVIALTTIFYRSYRVKEQDGQFAYIHWQIARRWSKLLLLMLVVLLSALVLAWYAHNYMGLMREMSYALAAGLGLFPTMISVLVLTVVESDALNHAKNGTLPKWARRRFLNETI